jgi:uncharacterized membrane protein YfcA
MYGIGGGSLLGPILVGRGLPVAKVAPAALASTFLTSLTGALTYAVLALTTPGDIGPDWPLGLASAPVGAVREPLAIGRGLPEYTKLGHISPRSHKEAV